MTSISNSWFIDKFDDIVNKYNNTYHNTIKIKPVNVKDNTYIDFGKESDNKDPKFEVGDHVRISKYKNIFAKGYTPYLPKEVFVIKKVENKASWTYAIYDLNGEEIVGTFHEKELLEKKREINYMLNGKAMIIRLIVRLKKKKLYKNESIFS